MTAAARALKDRAHTYWNDARALEQMQDDTSDDTGLTREQWVVVYETISDELHKIAAEVDQ